MAYKITGNVLSVMPTLNLTSKSGNSYSKRDLIITAILFDPHTGKPYEDSLNTPKFTFIGERCKDLDNLKQGDTVTISFSITGRKFEKDGKSEYYTEVRPSGIVVQNKINIPSVASQNKCPFPPEQMPIAEASPIEIMKNDELPF